MSDTATQEPSASYTVNTDNVGEPYIQKQEVVIVFQKTDKGPGAHKTTSKKGKLMFVMHYEIKSPEKGKCLAYDDMTMSLTPDPITGQPIETLRILSNRQNTEWWNVGFESTDEHLTRLLKLLKLPLGANANTDVLFDGRLEGKAFRVLYGSRLEAQKENGVFTGEIKLKHKIYKFLDVATSDNKIAAVE